jgi:hypothetical protein
MASFGPVWAVRAIWRAKAVLARIYGLTVSSDQAGRNPSHYLGHASQGQTSDERGRKA